MTDILIIEDEILIQKSLKTLLERRGATVQCTANGREAIELILKHNFDKIVCDLMLQDISGFDVIEETKRKYDPAEISKKFIIITAYSSEQVINKAGKYQCRVINKPFADLKNALDQIME